MGSSDKIGSTVTVKIKYITYYIPILLNFYKDCENMQCSNVIV